MNFLKKFIAAYIFFALALAFLLYDALVGG